MKRSIRFRLTASICAAILFICAFSLISVPTLADKAEDAIKVAKAAAVAAEKATKDAAKAKKDADEAQKKAGLGETEEDQGAAAAANAADEAAKAADEAQDKAQEEQQEADDAANDAKNAGGNDEEKNKEAAKQQKEADEAAGKAKQAEKEASDKEKESDEAEKKADGADKKIENRDVKKKKKAAREARKLARAARRAAAKRIREAEKSLDERKKREGTDPTPGTKDLEKLIEELKKRLYPPREEPLNQGRVITARDPDKIESGANQRSRTITGKGLHTVEFDTINGKVKVHLPDDMAAGDTISGSVVQEPQGSTPAEKEKNLEMLQGLVIEIGGKVIPSKQSRFTIQPVFEMAPDKLAATQSQTLLITIRNGNEGYETAPNQLLGRAVIPSNPQTTSGPQNPSQQSGTTPSGAVITPDPNAIPNFQVPPIGQQGRPIEIFGPFDGNSSNTALAFGPARSTVQDFEKNTENVSAGFGLIRPLAESPHKMVFESPMTFTGPVQLMLQEGDAKTLAPYRNVGVRLSAPKTNLIRGERTTLTVEVRGLEGIQKDVPLELDSRGVITMDGGNSQNLRISPTEVSREGTYTTSRAITGQQAGAFTVSATVVVGPFNTCLQDDSDPGKVVLWNTFTGDYLFTCRGCSPPPEQKTAIGPAEAQGQVGAKAAATIQSGPKDVIPPVAPGILSIGWSRGVGSTLTPSNVVRKGCIITLTHNAPDRRVNVTFDTCNKTGNASVQSTSPKANFAIADKTTANNTCLAP